MEHTVRVFDQQYLLQTAADLLTRRSENQKLRDSIRAAEASSVQGTSTPLPGFHRLIELSQSTLESDVFGLAVQRSPCEAPSHCPKCDGVPRLYLRMPNIKNQSAVYLYRCVQCTALIWMNE